MNVTLTISSMQCGGAERCMAVLADRLVRRGYTVTLLTYPSEKPDFFSLPDAVRRITYSNTINTESKWFDLLSHIKKLTVIRKTLLNTNPDIVISFIDVHNIFVLASLLGTKIPAIVQEHSDPPHYPLNRRWQYLRRLVYPCAAAVVVMTDEILQWCHRFWPRWNAVIIPNGVIPPVVNGADNADPKTVYHIVSMGRLSEEKRFSILIDTFARIAGRYPNWNLIIYGDGECRESLESQIDRLCLRERIRLPGAVADSGAAFSHADLFVLTSRVESFGLVLTEAMSYGLPAIAFDCPSGPRHIVRHNLDGLLVENGNIEQLRAAMEKIMNDESLRKHMGERAKEVVERFSVERMMNQWEALIRTTCENRR